jgi:urease accessory protein
VNLPSVVPLFAHLVTTGVGPFYDGVAHFFMSLEELLPVLVVAALGGLRGPRAGRWVLAALPVAWLAGGLVGLARPSATIPVTFTAALLLVPAVLVAWDRELPLWLVTTLAAIFGLWVGVSNGAAMEAGGAGFRGLLGAAASALVVTTLGAALAASLPQGWPRIVLRVAGSWMAALALLALGWTLRG